MGVIALSDIVEIKPAGLVFGKPASISFSVKQDIPPGMALVVLKLDSRNAPLGLRRTAALVSEADSRVIAQAVAGPVTLPANPLCQSPQYVDAAGTFTLAGIAAAVRTMVVAVPESMCSAIAVLPAGQVPVDTTSACDRDSQFGYVGSRVPAGLTDDESSLLNRHVNCRASQSGEDYVEVDMLKDVDGGLTRIAPASADLGSTDTVQVALVKFEFQVSMFGKSDVLGKTLRYRARVSSYQENATYKGPNKRPDVYLRPKLESYCNAVGYDGFPEPASFRCNYTPKAIRASAGGGWSEWADMPIGFQWTTAPGNSYDMAFFNINLELFETRIEGSDAQFKRPGARLSKTMTPGLGYLPTLRCDRGLAQVTTTGCVFPQAAAVYVLKTSDSSVTEAAEHVGEAQASGSPGRFALKPGTRAFPDSASGGRGLQRFKNAERYDNPNRKAACESTNALIKTRPPQSSRTCSPNAPGCECDEYPFNSTWQGAAFAPNTTSVKWINGKQNQNAGGEKLSNWYRTERLLDLANYPADGVTLPSGGGSSDFFWVYGSIN